MTEHLAAAVDRGDLDELTRLVDGLVDAREWAALQELRDRCERALERGRQLWPVVHHVEYRLALEAPAPVAAAQLREGAGRFAPGPLAEVAAQHHTWRDLAPHVPAGPVAALALHERVLRGEDLRDEALPGPDPLELPRVLQPWEPAYPLATYRAEGAVFPGPDAVAPEPFTAGAAASTRRDPVVEDALLALVQGWTTGSEATADVVAVDGDAHGAIAALGASRPRAVEVTPAVALAWAGWAAACGGTHGRRRGAATGRLDAWLAAAALTGLDQWPLPGADLGTAIAALRWYLWDAGGPVPGWSLHLAVADPARGIAWAIAAHDPA